MNGALSPCCLTIAGSDSGGNAGVQADLRAFHAYGLHGCTVFAALTAQNPHGVSAIHAVPVDFVAAQLAAVLGVYDIRGMKTGMLSDPAAIEVIADRLAAHVNNFAALVSDAMSSLSRITAQIPGANVEVEPWSAAECIAWYAALSLLLLFLRRVLARRKMTI